jgi:hypothetical protein
MNNRPCLGLTLSDAFHAPPEVRQLGAAEWVSIPSKELEKRLCAPLMAQIQKRLHRFLRFLDFFRNLIRFRFSVFKDKNLHCLDNLVKPLKREL